MLLDLLELLLEAMNRDDPHHRVYRLAVLASIAVLRTSAVVAAASVPLCVLVSRHAPVWFCLHVGEKTLHGQRDEGEVKRSFAYFVPWSPPLST